MYALEMELDAAIVKQDFEALWEPTKKCFDEPREILDLMLQIIEVDTSDTVMNNIPCKSFDEYFVYYARKKQ